MLFSKNAISVLNARIEEVRRDRPIAVIVLHRNKVLAVANICPNYKFFILFYCKECSEPHNIVQVTFLEAFSHAHSFPFRCI